MLCIEYAIQVTLTSVFLIRFEVCYGVHVNCYFKVFKRNCAMYLFTEDLSCCFSRLYFVFTTKICSFVCLFFVVFLLFYCCFFCTFLNSSARTVKINS